ncbi:MAG: nucleotidyltransferase domain-containing protein [Bacteroidota bacterium]
MQSIQSILEDLKKEFRGLYGDELYNLILFGSHARGEATEDSDIDLLVVLNKSKFLYSEELCKYALNLLRLDLKYDCIISAKPATVEQYQNSKFPLFKNVRLEGIKLWKEK